MNEKNEKHLHHIKEDFIKKVDEKYRKGNKEHSGDLFDTNLFDEMEGEIIDAWVYLKTMRAKYEKK